MPYQPGGSGKVALMAVAVLLVHTITPTTDAFLVPGCHRHPSGLHSIISRSTRTKRSKRTRSHNNLHPHHTFSFARIKTHTKPMTRQQRSEGEEDFYGNGSLFQEDHNYGIVSVLERYKEMEYKVIQDPPPESKNSSSKTKKNKSHSKPKKEPHQLLLAPENQPQQQQPAWMLQFSTAQEQLGKQKRRVQQFIEEPVIEFASAALILLSSILVAVDTLPNLPIRFIQPLETIQEILAYLFFVEFLTRWWSCTEDPKSFTPSSKKSNGGRRYKYYITQPLVLVDVIVVVLPLLSTTLPLLSTTFPLLDTAFPDWLSGQSGLINLRLLRVLRLQRVLQDELIFSKFVYAINPYNNNNGMMKGSGAAIVQPWELQLARVVLSLFTLLSVAAGLIYTTEHLVNPDIEDYFTALYFTLTTLTTVGFGDISPVTWQGKVVVSGSILAGITIIPAQAASLVDSLLQRNEERQRLEREERETSAMLSAKRNASNNNRDAMQATSSSMASSTTSTSLSTGSSTSSSSRGGDVTLLHAAKCPNCKTGLHWSHAKFCYNCATALNTGESSLVLPESYKQ